MSGSNSSSSKLFPSKLNESVTVNEKANTSNVNWTSLPLILNENDFVSNCNHDNNRKSDNYKSDHVNNHKSDPVNNYKSDYDNNHKSDYNLASKRHRLLWPDLREDKIESNKQLLSSVSLVNSEQFESRKLASPRPIMFSVLTPAMKTTSSGYKMGNIYRPPGEVRVSSVNIMRGKKFITIDQDNGKNLVAPQARRSLLSPMHRIKSMIKDRQQKEQIANLKSSTTVTPIMMRRMTTTSTSMTTENLFARFRAAFTSSNGSVNKWPFEVRRKKRKKGRNSVSVFAANSTNEEDEEEDNAGGDGEEEEDKSGHNKQYEWFTLSNHLQNITNNVDKNLPFKSIQASNISESILFLSNNSNNNNHSQINANHSIYSYGNGDNVDSYNSSINLINNLSERASLSKTLQNIIIQNKLHTISGHNWPPPIVPDIPGISG